VILQATAVAAHGGDPRQNGRGMADKRPSGDGQIAEAERDYDADEPPRRMRT
jgi:hypothetical protein